jgi:NitT/TauT family transport system ATP-binding protein
MEIVSSHGGCMDVFELDELTEYDFGHTLAVVKGGEMLHFLDTPQNAVVLTDLGRRLLVLDANGRKALVNQQLRALRTFRFLIQLLDRAAGKRLPKEIVVEELVIRLPSQDPEQLFDIVVGWGRYAELFGYEPQSEMLYSSQPQAADTRGET